ncbi:Ribosomal protein S18 acetylase RimI [Geodermatophilus obscurus]|uniref:Ribosomal protein S18 acetylase RimI n=1 Tax=Geodermatophilus obscurus TaxID=1861 RepID=A0A1M7RYQ3_9ACTN|nr:GNAT family N-acetyltransferase [Geodermatophilus obscurus]SHN51296.1 Ribosomal protein S18 acetylase RimI [Geodermatophilus obscurus]
MTRRDSATTRRSTPVLGRDVVIAPVPPAQRATAALLAARAMQDNPMHVAALGPDLSRRVEVMNRAFGVLLTPSTRHLLGAWQGDRLVGIAAYTSSRHCRPDRGQWLRLPPTLVRAGPRAPRLLRWLAAWSGRDPGTPHSHLGPVAVDPLVRGQGVGSRLLAEYVGGLDRDGESGYLETDKAENVRLYRRFGFEVVARADVLGVPNWFMARRPAARSPGIDQYARAGSRS